MKTIHSSVLMPNFSKSKDGLLPVIVQDKHHRTILMLAYTNREGFLETLESGQAVYYSRSRKRRWKKGEESGNTQLVVDVSIDCDGDAIIYLVIQNGTGACHTGKQSCFWRSVIGSSLEASVGRLSVEMLSVHEDIVNGRP